MKRKADKVVEMLIFKGCWEIKSKSHYRQFKIPGREDFYFVGRNGALRMGQCASDSVSLSCFIKIKKEQ